MSTQILSVIIWPLTAAFLFLVVLAVLVVFFRRESGSLIKRVRKLGSFEMDSHIESKAIDEQQAQVALPDPTPDPLDQIIVSSKKWVTSREKTNELAAHFKTLGRPLDSENEKMLLSFVGHLTVLKDFENMYAVIYGSQIYLLKMLNTNRVGFSPDQMEHHVQQVKARFPDQMANIETKSYLQFLIGRQLVGLIDGVYRATQQTADFLAWMAEEGRPEAKPL